MRTLLICSSWLICLLGMTNQSIKCQEICCLSTVLANVLLQSTRALILCPVLYIWQGIEAHTHLYINHKQSVHAMVLSLVESWAELRNKNETIVEKIYPLNSINHMASPAFLSSHKIVLHTACVFLGGCAH